MLTKTSYIYVNEMISDVNSKMWVCTESAE